MELFLPDNLFAHGITDLISVTPPGAKLAPSSKLVAAHCGKVPGRRLPSGLWVGYNWRATEPTAEDVHRWSVDGANVGLRADRWPAVDIDSLDKGLVEMITNAAFTTLGDAPRRVGRAPKQLLMYRTEEPFSRMRLWVTKPGDERAHLVEVLGQGQQYVVSGTHPQTRQPYRWLDPVDALPAEQLLTPITREEVEHFLKTVEEYCDVLGYPTEREGDGRPVTRSAGAQDDLVAPSLEVLQEAVSKVPNDNDLFPGRADYLKMGYAIRASWPQDDEEAYQVFAEWAARWEGNGRADGNDPEVVREDWRRMTGAKSVGWPWIAELARGFGFDAAGLDFDPTAERPEDGEGPAGPIRYSEQWLAEFVAGRRSGDLRFVPETGRFLVWNDAWWVPDAILLAEDVVKQELRVVADRVAREAATDKDAREALKTATAICSAAKAANVTRLLQSERSIALGAEVLDHNPWVINTPKGVLDLRTGRVTGPDPDQLCTRATSVPVDWAGEAPRWEAFLAESTGGDVELQHYLQKVCGYALTGVTREQNLVFIWGPGGNGKSIFLNVLTGILGRYAKVAAMDTFTSSAFERHTTDLASLHGARLVTASETQAGKRWDEARVKALTGGEPISARFMRQDNFTFTPQFKLIFVGNHKPELRDIDDAMRRRIHLVPFTHRPTVVDQELGTKLRAEWPAILAWMVQGCLAWQAEGLKPPAIVQSATEEYFESEDGVGRWLEECCEIGGYQTLTQELFESWREWANRNGEYVGTLKRLVSALAARKLARYKDSKSRRAGFEGIRPKPVEVGDLAGI